MAPVSAAAVSKFPTKIHDPPLPAWYPRQMITMEDRVKSLEQEVSGKKAFLERTATKKMDWENTVRMFENDPLFREAIQLGREYRETQPLLKAGS